MPAGSTEILRNTHRHTIPTRPLQPGVSLAIKSQGEKTIWGAVRNEHTLCSTTHPYLPLSQGQQGQAAAQGTAWVF